jgi:hypothetical protein
MQPGRNAPSHDSRPALARLQLSGHERPPAGPVSLRTADLDLGAVDAQVHALGGGAGEHVRQRPQPQPGLAGYGEAPRGEQRPYLTDGPADGRAVHAVEQRQGGGRELEPQDDQGGDDPVGEHQVMTGARAGRPPPAATAPIAQPGFLLRRPRPGQLIDQLA